MVFSGRRFAGEVFKDICEGTGFRGAFPTEPPLPVITTVS
jgi:hypothetical protein